MYKSESKPSRGYIQRAEDTDRDRDRDTGRQAERERKQDGRDRRGGGKEEVTGLHEVGAVWSPVWPILGPQL